MFFNVVYADVTSCP